MRVIGTTRDDAAGEAFDKTARILGLEYPGGAAIDRLSKQGDPKKYKLPRAQVQDSPYDFSFSGVKTAAVNLVHNARQKGEDISVPDLAAAISNAVAEAIAPRVVSAALENGRKTVVAAGGVAANSTLRAALQDLCSKNGLKLCLPPLKLCGDNGSMIAAQAYYEFMAGNTSDSAQNCYATMPAEEKLHLWDL